jgi:hypothetical protein
MSREKGVRQMLNPNVLDMEYPYSYLHEYDLNPKIMIGEPIEDSIDFPSCVTHYYWIHKGVHDEDSWRVLFRYYDREGKARYGFYVGECDYTGFDCRGDMELYVSDRYDILIDKALSDRDYAYYIMETDKVE